MSLTETEKAVIELCRSGDIWLSRRCGELQLYTFVCYRRSDERFVRQLTIHAFDLEVLGSAKEIAEFVNRNAFYNETVAGRVASADDGWENTVYFGCNVGVMDDGEEARPWRFRVTMKNEPFSFAEGRSETKMRALKRASDIAEAMYG